MQLSRAARLSSASTTYQGACLMSVCVNISSLAREYSTQRARDSRSMGLSFQRLVGSSMRAWNRRSCSSSLTENQYFTRMDARAHQHPLELRAGAQELLVLVLRAEAHHPLDARPVVPAPVEEDDLARGGQVRGRSAGSTTGSSRARVGAARATTRQTRGFMALGDALDDAALARGIAALEDHDDFEAGVLDPFLELHQLHVQGLSSFS